MSAILQALVIVALAAGAAVLTHEYHPRAPALSLIEAPVQKDEVNLRQVQERWKGDVVWIDARSEEVYQKGHIPGALLLNEQGFNEQSFALMDVLQTTTKPVIIYCDGEKCDASRTIHKRLLEVFPLDNCYVLKGGWPAWKAAQK